MQEFQSSENLLNRIKQPFIVGIAGDSGSGKTVFSGGIKSILGKDLVKTIEMDGYHRENRKQREISGILPLDPTANYLDKLKDDLEKEFGDLRETGLNEREMTAAMQRTLERNVKDLEKRVGAKAAQELLRKYLEKS